MRSKLFFPVLILLLTATFTVSAQPSLPDAPDGDGQPQGTSHLTAPTAVTLISPVHKAIVPSNNPSFEWDTDPQAEKYVFKLKNGAGVTVMKRKLMSNQCTSEKCTVYTSPAITTTGAYFWSVKVKRIDGTKVKSQQYKLKVLTKMQDQFTYILNTHRCDAGLAPLALNSSLNKASKKHSKDMDENNYFDHTGLDGSRFTDRARRAGYEGSPMGENIARGYPSAQSVFNGWWNSDGHKRNMMNGGAREFGIGRKGNYWTMVTGKSGDAVIGKCPKR